MTQELTPNTQITQENVGLLKAGDWLRHKPTGWLMPFVRLGPFGITCIKPTSGEEYDAIASNLTYIGPDLGDGWIGWSGGENPVPGMRVEVRLRNAEDVGLDVFEAFALPIRSDGQAWVHGGGPFDIIAFRPALSPPAEGEVEPFAPSFYDELLAHAWKALRERKPFEINADGAIAIITQAKADRAGLASAHPQPNGE